MLLCTFNFIKGVDLCTGAALDGVLAAALTPLFEVVLPLTHSVNISVFSPCISFVQDTNIGNWVLKQQVDGSEITFKFHRAITLKPGATCQVSPVYALSHTGRLRLHLISAGLNTIGTNLSTVLKLPKREFRSGNCVC